MEKSNVTDYMAEYLEKNGISTEETGDIVGIPTEKLEKGSGKALTAEEFLELCVYLKIRPEDVSKSISDRKKDEKDKKVYKKTGIYPY